MKSNVLLFLSFLFFLSACGGDSADGAATGGESSSAAAEERTSPAAEPAASADEVVELRIEGNDLMQFNLKEMEVQAGQRVRLTLVHTGQMPVETMGHNWVLLAQGTDMADFGTKAASARDNGYIPPSEEDKVIVHTELIGGGEETTIEFDAPPAGEYTFICSFPGHYALMNGTFTVNPA